jgi:hypothetical protein
MTMATKNSIFDEYKKRYWKGSKEKKKEILTHVCFVTGMHRKAAIRKFSVLQTGDPTKRDKRGRDLFYTPDVTAALKVVWELGSEVCGELLREMIPEYVSILTKNHQWIYGKETTEKLLKMSEITVKRRIATFVREKVPNKGKSTTKPSDLKIIVPIFTGPWSDKPPGYGQIDTVGHCGSTLLGDFVYTLNYTDIASMWGERRAQWNKGKKLTRESIEAVKNRLPFPLKGVHPDTGSEFLNWTVVPWCQEQKIELTRSRPNHKNDNQYIEERNGHIVRKFVGYQRLDAPETVTVLNQLYEVLSVYLNHFVAVRKCLKKERIGSLYKRIYDKAKTPYQRLLEQPTVSKSDKDKLIEIHKQANLWELKQQVELKIQELYDTQKRYEKPL